MRFLEAIRAARSAFSATLRGRYEDDARPSLRKGEVFIILRDGKTGEVQQRWHNIVTLDATRSRRDH